MPAELIQDLKTAARDKNISAGRYIKDAVKEALQKGKAGVCLD